MSHTQDAWGRIESNFRAIESDLERLETDLGHFHKKDDRRRFDHLKLSIRQLHRQVSDLAQECGGA